MIGTTGVALPLPNTAAGAIKRQLVLDTAFATHPERFVNGRPTPPQFSKEVWVNKPGSP